MIPHQGSQVLVLRSADQAPPTPGTSTSVALAQHDENLRGHLPGGLFQGSLVAVAVGWRDTHRFKAFKVEGGRSTSAAIEGIRPIPDLLAHLFVMSTVDRVLKGLIPRDEITD